MIKFLKNLDLDDAMGVVGLSVLFGPLVAICFAGFGVVIAKTVAIIFW